MKWIFFKNTSKGVVSSTSRRLITVYMICFVTSRSHVSCGIIKFKTKLLTKFNLSFKFKRLLRIEYGGSIDSSNFDYDFYNRYRCFKTHYEYIRE